MNLQNTRLTLSITFDNDVTEHPENWAWHELLPLTADESVGIVESDAGTTTEPQHGRQPTYEDAQVAYVQAATNLGNLARRHIVAKIAEAFPAVKLVRTKGQWNEESELRIELFCPDGVDETDWETLVEDLEQPIYDMLSVTGDDWFGDDELEISRG